MRVRTALTLFFFLDSAACCLSARSRPSESATMTLMSPVATWWAVRVPTYRRHLMSELQTIQTSVRGGLPAVTAKGCITASSHS